MFKKGIQCFPRTTHIFGNNEKNVLFFIENFAGTKPSLPKKWSKSGASFSCHKIVRKKAIMLKIDILICGGAEGCVGGGRSEETNGPVYEYAHLII